MGVFLHIFFTFAGLTISGEPYAPSNRKKKIVLLELGGSHVECLYAQVLFLQPGYEVHVICNRHLWPELEHMEGISGHQLHDTANARGEVVPRIKQYLKEHHISSLVINTTEISLVRDLVLRLLFTRIDITGVVHNARSSITALPCGR